MKTINVGELIGKLRREKNISQSALCHGLCSVQLLSLIERGERIPDILLLEALLQRLGKSPEMLEIVLTAEEYKQIKCRDEIEKNLRFGKQGEARIGLEHYAKTYAKKDMMQQMYVYRITCILEMEQGNLESAEEWIQKAVQLTITQKELEKGIIPILSIFELENLVILSDVWNKQGKIESAVHLLNHCIACVSGMPEDERIKVMSKATSVLGEIYNRTAKYEECIAVCLPVFEMQRGVFNLQMMPVIMNNLIVAYHRLHQQEEEEKYKKWLEVLERAFSLCGWSSCMVNGLYFNTYLREYYLDGEVIRGERLRRKMSQAELAEGIYECVETLSRIENGKVSPNRVKYERIMKRLVIGKTRYSGHLNSDELNVLELDGEIEKCIATKEFDKAEKMLFALEQQLDMTEQQNIQMVDRRKNLIAFERGEITAEEVVQSAKELINLTYEFPVVNCTRIPFRNEAYLYNQLCSGLRNEGKHEECFNHYKRMLQLFADSKISMRYHYRGVIPILANLSHYMERCGKLDEAEKYSIEGMRYLLFCGKSSVLHTMVSNLAFVSEKRNQSREDCIAMFADTYYLCDLFHHAKIKQICKKYLLECYGYVVE